MKERHKSQSLGFRGVAMIATAMGSFDRQKVSAIADFFDSLPGLACVIGSV